MKIAISADGTDLESRVAHRLGMSQYLLIIDLDTDHLEPMPNPGSPGHRGTGMQAVVIAVRSDVKAVLTGYCSPAARNMLEARGIEVLTGLSGSVEGVLTEYRKHLLRKRSGAAAEQMSRRPLPGRAPLIQAMRSSAHQFGSLLPVVGGVVLLMGLFNAFVSKEFLTSLFPGNLALDTLWGACLGSILAGNPINSYVIGGELLKQGVSLFAVTALIITWVTVGLVQLPAEMVALGRRFALLRNAICFILSIPVATITVGILNLASR
jgi:predicted Fe-Mo cluster-binding NifX family protein